MSAEFAANSLVLQARQGCVNSDVKEESSYEEASGSEQPDVRCGTAPAGFEWPGSAAHHSRL